MQVTDAQVIEALRIYHRHEGGPTPSMKAAIDFLQIPEPNEGEIIEVAKVVVSGRIMNGTDIVRYALQHFVLRRNNPPKVDPRREAILKGPGPYSSGTFVTGELAAELADKILKALDEVKP